MLTNFLFFMSMNRFLLLPIHVQQMGGDEADVGLVQARTASPASSSSRWWGCG